MENELERVRALFRFDDDDVLNSMPNNEIYGTAVVVKREYWDEMVQRLAKARAITGKDI